MGLSNHVSMVLKKQAHLRLNKQQKESKHIQTFIKFKKPAFKN